MLCNILSLNITSIKWGEKIIICAASVRHLSSATIFNIALDVWIKGIPLSEDISHRVK